MFFWDTTLEVAFAQSNYGAEGWRPSRPPFPRNFLSFAATFLHAIVFVCKGLESVADVALRPLGEI